jgi:hypothetical protein
VPVAKFNADAMEQCRTAVSSQAGQFGAIGDSVSAPNLGGDVFGKLDSSARFASAVTSLATSAGHELTAAEGVLGKVERALDAVQASVADTEDANKRSFQV